MNIEEQVHTYHEGNFLFISNEQQRNMLQDAYQATLYVNGGLEEMKKDPGINGYIFSKPSAIRKEIDERLMQMETGSYHSGCSYAFTMREVQAIARLGWSAYVRMILIEQHERTQVQQTEQNHVSFIRSRKDKKRSSLENEEVIKVCAICLCNNVAENTYVIQSEETSTLMSQEENYVSCGHVFHQACLEKHIQEYHKKKCPLCAANIRNCYLLDENSLL